ncbi:phage tail spike protein [Paenibacillus sp. MBLB4367]|uniref:phage tail spike protein n=1 Tax=Paenibacillus sp. MBLB4367 TaxID=3384767 RepID=UPI003907F241
MDTLIALDRNEIPLNILTKAKGAQIRERLNGESLLSFEIPFDGDEYALLQLDGYVKVEGQLYIIKSIDVSDSGQKSASVQCVHVYVELVDEYIDATLDLLGVTASYAVTQALNGTPFSIGSINAPGLHDIDISEISSLEALQKIREKWDVDLWFDNRTVYLGRRGTTQGEEIRYGRNLKALRKPSTTNNVITRLYVYGRDGLTIESINGGKKYIDSPNIGLYRRPKCASVRFNDIADVNELKGEAQRYLSKHDTMIVSYQVDYYDLEMMGIPGGRVELGDSTTLTHLPFSIQTIGTRVVERIRYLKDRKAGSVTLSSFIESTVDDFVSIKRRQRGFERYATQRDAEIAQQTGELQQAQTDFEEYIDDVFRDGVITEAEAKAIAEHKRQLAKEKADVDAEYAKVYANTYLTGTIKTNLATAKTNYDTSYAELISAIDAVAADGQVTPAERAAVDDGFADLTTKLSALRQTLEDAWDAITRKVESNASADATAKATAAQSAAEAVAYAQSQLAEEEAKAHADGIVTAEEQARIAQAAANLAAAKEDASVKAAAAEQAAAADATSKANAAREAAELVALQEAQYARLQAEAYADNVVTDEEQARLTQAAANLAAAKLDALAKSEAARDAAIGHADINYSGTKNKVDNGNLYVKDKYGQVIVNDEGLDLANVAGYGIESGGIIRVENVSVSGFPAVGITVSRGDIKTVKVIDVGNTSAFPASNSTINSWFIWYNANATIDIFGSISYNQTALTYVTWTGKTATTLTGVEIWTVTNGFNLQVVNVVAGQKIIQFPNVTADIVVSGTTVVMPDKRRFVVPETRFNSYTVSVPGSDEDGWKFTYLYVNSSGVPQITDAGTSGGENVYPPNPPSGSVRLGYLLVGFGKEAPDGTINSSKNFDGNGYPIWTQRIYHDNRYRDERAVRANGNEALLGGAPYGAQTLAVSVAGQAYQTYYIPVGKSRRSVNLSITLDDGSGYDNVLYGASVVVGRKAANNADGKGRPLWATYVDADGGRGHVAGQRNTAPYGVHVLSPRVWNKSYTMLYDCDLMPDPNDASTISLKLTFYNYSGSAESFNLKLNWHAL